MPNLLLLQRLYYWARGLKSEVMVLYYVMKHPATPFAAKCLATLVVGYALSPIDFIPDFIPVLGYLDDLVILPALIALTIRHIPEDVWERSLQKSRGLWQDGRPKKWYYALPVLLIWCLIIWLIVRAIRF